MLQLIIIAVVVAICTVSCITHMIGNIRLSRAVKRRLFNI
jgi:hypothetical protein